ncbi:hypothetical protein ACFOWM_03585 [Ferruginibacter yonginensis]|uniref:Phage protein n=1 Tax=Ferruginibacter yonginensis TaxID=1310416 RepID=A0ABV8QP24_9BACT
MKNKMSDLNNALFAQLERLADEDTTGDKLHEEMNKARGIVAVSNQIVNNYRMQLDAAKFLFDNGYNNSDQVAKSLGYQNDKEINK